MRRALKKRLQQEAPNRGPERTEVQTQELVGEKWSCRLVRDREVESARNLILTGLRIH